MAEEERTYTVRDRILQIETNAAAASGVSPGPNRDQEREQTKACETGIAVS